MSIALEYIKVGFKSGMAYRKAALLGIFSSVLALFMQVMLWKSLLGSQAAPQASRKWKSRAKPWKKL